LADEEQLEVAPVVPRSVSDAAIKGVSFILKIINFCEHVELALDY
jgi:hypothetical protein